MSASHPLATPKLPVSGATVLELLKPITWFAPMWAFGCGVVSVGQAVGGRWPMGAASKEAGRPIPAGRLPGRTGLAIAVGWTVVSLLVAAALGRWAFGAAVLGMALAWAYSAPPLRLKADGWWGNTACAACYEGLPWFTGAAIMAGQWPDGRIVLVAALYSLGAHGIMTLNDFKSVEGDRRMAIASLPVVLGVGNAALLACWIMAVPQLGIVVLLAMWGFPLHALAVLGLLLVQLGLMARLLRRPRELAPWYNGTGTTLYVIGMMVAAFALRSLVLG